MMYEATFRNLTFDEAKMLYALSVGVGYNEIYGTQGSVWSGLAGLSRNPEREHKTVTIRPMKGEKRSHHG